MPDARLAGLSRGSGFRISPLLLAVSMAASGTAARAESTAGEGATVIELTLRGGEAWGVVVELGRSIPGRRPDYTWSGVTDAGGRLALTIPAADPSLVSGDYQARAVNLYGGVVGEWRRIPIERGRRQALELVIGSGEVRRLPAGLEEALVAHYPLDGDARDASGNGWHGAPSGVEAGEDRFGNGSGALVFQGPRDRVDLPHEVLDGRRDVSISFWLRTANPGSQTVLSAANRSNDNEHIVYLWDQSSIHFFSHGAQGYGDYCWVDIPPVADGRWHHIAVIRDAAAGKADFYVDGAGLTDHCGHLDYRALRVEAGGLILGQEQDRLGGGFDPNQALDGSLDDLRIYDKALSAAEVRTLLGRDAPEEPPARSSTVVAYYPFDGGAGDASGNEYHGALRGPEPGEDRFGNEGGALVFRGTRDRIDLPHEVLDGLRDVSVSFWLKTANPGQQAIVSGANRSNDNEYLVYLPGEEQVRLFSHGGGGRPQHECAVDVEPLAGGRWHHIVWVRNASGGYSDFYVDGVGRTGVCGHLEYGALSVEDGGLVLGQDQDRLGGGFAADQAFQGSLDDLWIYDRALTAAEVQALGGRFAPVAKEAAHAAAVSGGLAPNAPNPFNASTWIPYRLAASGHVRLEICNLLGQPVRVLVDGFQSAGAFRVEWDARDQRGKAVAAGVYLARLVHPGGAQSRRLLYLE